MSRLEIPVRRKVLWYTGDVCLWVEVSLHLKDGSGSFHQQDFRLDTASDLTTFPAYDAKRLRLPLPQQAAPVAVHTQTGLAIRSGLLRFRIGGMDPTEYAVPCLFLGDPDTPPNPAQRATFPRKLLQPFQLLDRLRFRLDHDPTSTAVYGTLTIEKK